MKKITVRICAVLLAIVLCANFTACSSKEKKDGINFSMLFSLVKEDGFSGSLGDLAATFEGDSAYVAVTELGYVGTGEEWLRLLISAKERDAITTVGASGNWFVGRFDSGVYALGSRGEKGETGATGEKGEDGLSGEKGEKGETGANGKNGEKGDAGANGEPGTNGTNGTNGINGKNGTDGKDGEDGLSAYQTFLKYHPEYTQTEAQWVEDLANSRLNTYSVSFNTNGGNEYPSVSVIGGYKLILPRVATKSHHVLDGWYKDDALTNAWDFNADTVSGDLTLYAKWQWVDATEGLEFIPYANGTEYWVTEPPFNLGVTFVGEVVIPAEYNGLPVTGIRYMAFYEQTGITSVIIPEGIKIIEDGVFYGCTGLTSINLPDSLTTIQWDAFGNCHSLTSINLPDSLKTIEYYAFQNCSSLTSLHIPAGVTSIDNYVFKGCTGLESITVDKANTTYKSEGNCLIRSSNNSLILGCSNSVIPDYVTRIDSYAFYYCMGLTSVTFPSAMISIGSDAFFGCRNLAEIKLASGNTSFTVDNNCLIRDKYLFLGCSGSIIPPYVTHILSDAFAGSGITSVDIPSSVTQIYPYAFNNCNRLTSVTIPGSVTMISSNAFAYCTALIIVTISGSVEELSSRMFAGCTSLKSVRLLNGLKSIGTSAFENCSALQSLTIPDTVESIGSNAFIGCRGLKSLHIGSGLKQFDASVFAYCASSLISITVSSSNTVVKSENNCLIDIESNILLLGCRTSIIPAYVTGIWGYAFAGCLGLTHIDIPEGVEFIGGDAFYQCYDLVSIVLPSTLTEIGFFAFYPNNLTAVYYRGSDWSKVTGGVYIYYYGGNPTLYYYLATPPTTAGDFWHYASDGVTPLVW